MSQEAVTKCDVCRCEISESKGCYLAFTRPGAIGITFGRHADRDLVPKGKQLVTQDLCGERCAQTRLSQFLAEISSAPTERQEA